MSFFDNYKALCEKQGKSPNGVAAELGIHSSSVTQWKQGSTPREKTLNLLADYFHVSVKHLLFGGDDEKNPDPVRAEALRDVIDKISGLPPSDVQRVAEYVAFLKSRGGK